MPGENEPQTGTEPNQGDPTPPAAPGTTPAVATATVTPPQGTIPEGYVPADALRAVTAERDRLAKDAKKREEDAAKQRGDFEQLAQTREKERDAAIERAKTTAIRSSFVSAIAPNVVDATAAYVLARDSGLLKDVNVSDDFEADEKAVKTAADEALKKFPYLKGGSKSFGDPADGNEGTPTLDPSKTDARTMLRYGYDHSGPTRRQG